MATPEESTPAATQSPSQPPSLMHFVLGFDASDAAARALEYTLDILSYREGSLEVIYVGRVPAAAASVAAYVREAIDTEAKKLEEFVRATAANVAAKLSFDYLEDGSVADELLAACARLSSANPNDKVVVVVGRSAHAYHSIVGSVPAALAHHSQFPVIMVP